MTLIDLPDGRVLDIEVTGPDDGVPLLFHHGTPGSVTQYRSVQRAAHAHGLRLVTYSRAGAGASTRKPGRIVLDVVDDMVAILDHLDAPRCVTAGWSGGGPHVLATAARLPERVTGACVIAGVAPFRAEGLDFLEGMGEQNHAEFAAAVEGEPALRRYLEADAAAMGELTPESIKRGMATLLPEADLAVFTDEEAEDLSANFTEGLRTGIDGWLDDDLAFVAPWGFEPGEVTVPTFVWQGSVDLMVPFSHGQWLAKAIPNAVAHLEPGHGHLSISSGAFLDTMMAELAGTLA